jgi:hypothetical protein
LISLTSCLESGSGIRTQDPSQLVAEKATHDAQELNWAVGLGHVVIAQDGAQILLVLHDKNASAHAAPAAIGALTASSMRSVEPWPSLDSTQTRPPCISTISRAMARDRAPCHPWPVCSSLSTCRNFSKMCSHSSTGMPGPVSLTVTVNWLRRPRCAPRQHP